MQPLDTTTLAELCPLKLLTTNRPITTSCQHQMPILCLFLEPFHSKLQSWQSLFISLLNMSMFHFVTSFTTNSYNYVSLPHLFNLKNCVYCAYLVCCLLCIHPIVCLLCIHPIFGYYVYSPYFWYLSLPQYMQYLFCSVGYITYYDVRPSTTILACSLISWM